MRDQPLGTVRFEAECFRKSRGKGESGGVRHMFVIRAHRGDGTVDRRKYSPDAAYRLLDALSDAIDAYEEQTREGYHQ